ncbi:MAG: hypothetical protein ABIE36_00575 [Candidatus Diapherotrites archaeon]
MENKEHNTLKKLSFLDRSPRIFRPITEGIFQANLDKMIDNAEIKEDFNEIELKLKYAKDNNLNIPYESYRFNIRRKMTEIYNKSMRKIA